MNQSMIRLLGAFALIISVFGGGPAAAASGGAALGLFPRDTTLVVSADMTRLRQSPAFGKLAAAANGEQLAGILDTLRREAGLDLVRDIDTATLGFIIGAAQSVRFALVVEGRVDEGKVIAFARANAGAFVEKTHRGQRYYDVGLDRQLAFIGKRVVWTSEKTMTAVIDVQQGKAPAAVKNAELMALIKGGDTGKDVWAAMVFPEDMRQEIAREADGHTLTALMLSVDASVGLAVAVHLDTSSKKAAEAIAALVTATRAEAAAEPALAALGLVPAVQNMTIEIKGAGIDMAVKASAAEVDGALRVLLQGP